MKQLNSILILSVLLLFISSCEEILEEVNAESGTEYFEFKVDGKQFESEGIPSECNALQFNYFLEPYLDLPAGYMLMHTSDCPDASSLTLTFQEVTPEYTGTSSLEDLNFATSFRPVFRDENNVIFNRLLDGSMTVDRFTGTKKHGSGRLSGTFEMRLIDSEKTDTLTITDGRFNFFVSQKLH